MKYEVTDNLTGKKFMLEGNAPPTEQDIHQQLKTTPQAPIVQTQQWKPTSISDDLSHLPIVGPMVKQLTGYAKDIGSGMAVRSKDYQAATQASQDAMGMVKKLQDRAMIETDPAKKQQLLNFARQQSATINNIGSSSQPQFSEDINKPYLQRGFQTAGNIAAFAEAPAAISGIVKKAPGVIKNIKNLNPYKGLPARMESLASKSKGSIPRKDFINAFKQNVKERLDKYATVDAKGNWKWADVDIKDYVNKIEDYINQGPEKITPTDLLGLRQHFAGQLPSGFFQRLMGKTLQDKVSDAARYVSTETAKDITPGLANTDWLYSRLRGILGPNELSAITRVGAVAGAPSVYKIIRNLLGSGGLIQSTQ